MSPPTNLSAVRRPKVFLSSFTRNEVEESVLGEIRRLRELLWELGGADELIWVAEKDSKDRHLLGKLREFDDSLAQDRSLEITDVLIDRLLASEQIVIVLGGKRRGRGEHGSLVSVKGRMSAVSHFEIELFRAAMCAQEKPVHVFMLNGFDPGPRLLQVIELLAPALPSLRSCERQSAKEIVDAVSQILRKPPPKYQAPDAQRWLMNLFESRNEQTSAPLLFMDGLVEPRSDGPDTQLVSNLLEEQEAMPDIERRLSRLWIAAREMMCVEQASPRLSREHLILWNRVITHWNGSASWGGLFGHIFGGVFACLNSLERIRHQLRQSNCDDLPEGEWKSPIGAYASAYYSFAKRMGGKRHFFLNRALFYVERTIEDQQNREPSIYAVRGSIHMHLWKPWTAANDYRRVLELRQNAGEPASKMGEALVDYGFATAACGRLLKGESLMLEGLRQLDGAHDGFRVRALRKLGSFYRLTLRSGKGKELLEQAAEIAKQRNMHDQTRQL